MRYAVNRYHIKITKDGKTMVSPDYYGYSSRAKAEEVRERWESVGFKAEIIDIKKQ